jgi:histone-binding protein RBBP4
MAFSHMPVVSRCQRVSPSGLYLHHFLTSNRVPDTNVREYRVLFGTNTSQETREYLQIARFRIPDYLKSDVELNDASGELGGYGQAKNSFEYDVIQRINHPSEINKARYMPQNPDLIVSMGFGGSVLVFDRTKHPIEPKDDSINAQMQLVGHQEEGFGLSWSPINEGQMVTASQDSTVRLWDIQGYSTANSQDYTAARVFSHHEAVVNDVEFHPKHSFYFASVSDDLSVQIVDTRLSDANPVAYKVDKAHADAVNCVAWHPKWDNLLATGSGDKTVAVWDMRFMTTKVHSISAHTDSVIKLEFHPHDPAILASASYDRRICMYDLSRVGDEQTEEESEDGPPEL